MDGIAKQHKKNDEYMGTKNKIVKTASKVEFREFAQT